MGGREEKGQKQRSTLGGGGIVKKLAAMVETKGKKYTRQGKANGRTHSGLRKINKFPKRRFSRAACLREKKGTMGGGRQLIRDQRPSLVVGWESRLSKG